MGRQRIAFIGFAPLSALIQTYRATESIRFYEASNSSRLILGADVFGDARPVAVRGEG